MLEVIIPFGGSCPHRQQALQWVRGRYPSLVTIATAPPGPWCKAAAVMPAVKNSNADVVAVADADCWTTGFDAAVAAVENGAAWTVPHLNVCRLTPEATTTLLAGEQPAAPFQTCEKPYPGVEGGGILVARREVILACPLDPRFIGWGQEDEAWGVALTALHGPPWRGTADLLHLWHPAPPRLSRARGSREGWNLRRQYFRARNNPAAMQQILGEAHDALSPHQPAMHPHAA